MLLEGVIAAVPDADGRVLVTVPALATDQALGPCPVMPRGATPPALGAACLVAIPETDGARAWVVAWE